MKLNGIGRRIFFWVALFPLFSLLSIKLLIDKGDYFSLVWLNITLLVIFIFLIKGVKFILEDLEDNWALTEECEVVKSSKMKHLLVFMLSYLVPFLNNEQL